MDTLKSNYKLYIFDLDGTLSKFKTGEILDGVKEWFDSWLAMPEDTRPYLALASNQGGVGLRYWMESNDFGNPEKYPTEESITAHIDKVLKELGLDRSLISVFVSYRYQSQKGNWSPVPDSAYNEDKTELNKAWSMDYRKPLPCMLEDAMAMHFVSPDETLMIGDWQEDREAADNAKCDYCDADTFFNRETVDDLPF